MGIPILLLVIAVAPAGCGNPEPPPSKPVTPEKSAAAVPPAEASKESAPTAPTGAKEPSAAAAKEAAPQAMRAEDYFYNPSGRRDPFMSLLVLEKESDRARLAGDIPPLERHAIPEMRVIGIVGGPAGFVAMLEMPDGRGYSVREGSIVGRNKGVVRRIDRGSVIVEETLKTRLGELQQRKYTLELRKKEEVPQP
ncbi:MAG: pilus assembly protein PilP [Nitrospirae bacterium]|nr:pilus assembly protein PilP [Nitrospirota bacterium]